MGCVALSFLLLICQQFFYFSKILHTKFLAEYILTGTEVPFGLENISSKRRSAPVWCDTGAKHFFHYYRKLFSNNRYTKLSVIVQFYLLICCTGLIQSGSDITLEIFNGRAVRY